MGSPRVDCSRSPTSFNRRAGEAAFAIANLRSIFGALDERERWIVAATIRDGWSAQKSAAAGLLGELGIAAADDMERAVKVICRVALDKIADALRI